MGSASDKTGNYIQPWVFGKVFLYQGVADFKVNFGMAKICICFYQAAGIGKLNIPDFSF